MPFRVQKNAASLKHVGAAADKLLALPPFRVQKNAASLKQEHGDHAAFRRRRAFRVQKNAASLKLAAVLEPAVRFAAFRVQKNAASLKHVVNWMSVGVIECPFRVQKNAASLKRDPHRRADGSGEPDPSAFRRTRPH